MLQFSKACLLLVTFLLGFTFPAWTEAYPHEGSQVVVSVYDDAGVSAAVLVQAEQRAARIFDEAGVDVVWKNCPSSQIHVGPDALVRAGEQSSPGLWKAQSKGVWIEGSVKQPAKPGRAGGGTRPYAVRYSTVSALRGPPAWRCASAPRSVSSAGEVFGVAFLSDEGTGCYSDVFYDRAMELHADWNVSLSDILGNVIAHELGHLLLGSNSHSRAGIMRAHWQGEELHRLSRGRPVVHQRAGQPYARETERSQSSGCTHRPFKLLSSDVLCVLRDSFALFAVKAFDRKVRQGLAKDAKGTRAHLDLRKSCRAA